jgi:hypothetical protein
VLLVSREQEISGDESTYWRRLLGWAVGLLRQLRVLGTALGCASVVVLVGHFRGC